MHDKNIMMTKQQREAILERMKVLQKAKALLLIPKLFLATIRQGDNFFEMDVDALQKSCQRNKQELRANGVIFLTSTRMEALIEHDVQWVQMEDKRPYCVDGTHILRW